ncbi:MAG: heavy metal-binding domain-containing protein [Acidimicrobiales bacterium]
MTLEPPTGGGGDQPLPEGEPPLPEAAGRRLGGGAWSSGLSVPDFATSLALGIEPVGYVQGFSVMQWRWTSYGPGLGMTMGGGMMLPPTGSGQYSESWRCPHGFVGGEHRVYGYNFEQAWVEQSWAKGWGSAYRRMMEEADALGAHGVIGVADDMHYLSGTGAAEFSIRGTAVVVPGAARPTTPFSTFLAGQRLAKLIEAGYAPVGVVAAVSSVQMFAYCVTRLQLTGSGAGTWSNNPGVGAIVQVGRAQRAARHLAREHLRRQLGGDALHGASVAEFESEIGEGDLAIQCTIKGTRVRRFKDFDPLPEPEPVVRLR